MQPRGERSHPRRVRGEKYEGRTLGGLEIPLPAEPGDPGNMPVPVLRG